MTVLIEIIEEMILRLREIENNSKDASSSKIDSRWEGI